MFTKLWIYEEWVQRSSVTSCLNIEYERNVHGARIDRSKIHSVDR